MSPVLCPCNASLPELTNTQQRPTHNGKKKPEEDNNSNTTNVTNNSNTHNDRKAVQVKHKSRCKSKSFAAHLPDELNSRPVIVVVVGDVIGVAVVLFFLSLLSVVCGTLLCVQLKSRCKCK
jgi:hypothetical protein